MKGSPAWVRAMVSACCASNSASVCGVSSHKGVCAALSTVVLVLLAAPAVSDEINLELRPTNELPDWGLVYQSAVEFSPIDNDVYTFKLALADTAVVTFDVLSSDGDVINTLFDSHTFDKGQHAIVWSGKDDQGDAVPNEVYIPRVTIHARDTTYVDDPRTYSGGEIVKNLEWTFTEKTLTYTLPEPARVLIRTGINAGPMMRALKHWEPSGAGTSVARWDGFDKDQVEYFADDERRWSIVQAYQIPQYAVITTGNESINYRTYRKLRGWTIPEFDLSKFQLQRSGVRLSKNYFLPRQFQPEVDITIDKELPVNRFDLPVATDKLRLTVDVPKEDRWILDASFYETSFYIDYQFASEEEQGFVPMVWDVDVSELSKGRHLATVQLFGFGGFIVSDSVEFWVDDL